MGLPCSRRGTKLFLAREQHRAYYLFLWVMGCRVNLKNCRINVFFPCVLRDYLYICSRIKEEGIDTNE